ncbi:MAG TPA: 2-dehydropantoate 2-reductase [Sediminispirochaeta sp.]|nr:2-dehydropantoate 2-reductase [Sediminispirochaeta sp.]
MNILVYGVGGIGGFISGRLGGLLKSAGSGLTSLNLVARGEHLKALQKRGLKFVDPDGTAQVVKPHWAGEDPRELEVQDVVILCVKGYDLDGAVDGIRDLVSERTVVLPLLNGADIYDRVRERLSQGVVLPGAIYISSTLKTPGEVRHSGGRGLIVTGPEPGRSTPRPEKLLGLFEQAGIPYQWSEDPSVQIWSKFIFISPFGLATAVSAKTIGQVLDDPELRKDTRAMMEEIAEIGKKRGVDLPADVVDRTLENATKFPHDTKTSFQRDIEAGKERDERDLFGGTVLRLGEKYGVETPVVRKYLQRL